jgi:hypothetical protein
MSACAKVSAWYALLFENMFPQTEKMLNENTRLRHIIFFYIQSKTVKFNLGICYSHGYICKHSFVHACICMHACKHVCGVGHPWGRTWINVCIWANHRLAQRTEKHLRGGAGCVGWRWVQKSWPMFHVQADILDCAFFFWWLLKVCCVHDLICTGRMRHQKKGVFIVLQPVVSHSSSRVSRKHEFFFTLVRDASTSLVFWAFPSRLISLQSR